MSVTAIGPGKPVSLRKGGGTLDVCASWYTNYDVDVVCLYELFDGRRGAVQALKPNPNFGSLIRAPYIQLHNDDRTGARKGGAQELLQVNLEHAADIRRLLVFAYVYDKDGTWGKVRNAAVNISHPTQGHFDFQLGRSRWGLPHVSRYFSRSCVLLTMDADGSGGLELLPQGTYFKGIHQQISDAYGLGINFAPNGYKD